VFQIEKTGASAASALYTICHADSAKCPGHLLREPSSMKPSKLPILFVLFAPVLAVLAGCSGSGGTVKGSVKLDGNPIGPRAKVEFEPVDPKAKLGGAVAWTKDDGSFEYAPPKGAFALKPGKYKVFISRMVDKDGNVPTEEEPGMLEMAGKLKNQVAAKYSNREKAEITVDIADGTNNLPPFEVKSK
jgi:hypothetical protein